MPRVDNVPLQAHLKGLVINRVDFCRAGSNGESDIVLFKRRDHNRITTTPSTTRKGATVPENTDPTPEQIAALQKTIDDAVSAAIAKHDAAIAEYLTATAKGEPVVDESDPVAKAVADAVAVEKAERLKLEEQVAKMRDEQATAVFKAQAASLPNVGGEDDVAKVLKSVAANCPDDVFKALETILNQSNERIAKGDLTSDVRGRQGTVADDAFAKLQAAADELRKNDPKLTPSDALSAAIKADPEAYAEYRKSLGTAA